jgi:hypothetical protein
VKNPIFITGDLPYSHVLVCIVNWRRVYSTEHVFSMDGSVASMPVFSQWFMTGNFRDGAQTAADFASASILVLMFIVPFVMVRRGAVPRGTVAAHTLGLSRKPEATSTSQNGPSAVKLEWWDEYLLRFHASPHAFTLSGHLSKWLGWNMFVPYVCLWRSRPGMCWALAGAVVYMYVGPWCVGHLYNDSIGVLFAWGIVSTRFVVVGDVCLRLCRAFSLCVCIVLFCLLSGFLPHLDACLYLNMTMWLVIGPLVRRSCAVCLQSSSLLLAVRRLICWQPLLHRSDFACCVHRIVGTATLTARTLGVVFDALVRPFLSCTCLRRVIPT